MYPWQWKDFQILLKEMPKVKELWLSLIPHSPLIVPGLFRRNGAIPAPTLRDKVYKLNHVKKLIIPSAAELGNIYELLQWLPKVEDIEVFHQVGGKASVHMFGTNTYDCSAQEGIQITGMTPEPSVNKTRALTVRRESGYLELLLAPRKHRLNTIRLRECHSVSFDELELHEYTALTKLQLDFAGLRRFMNRVAAVGSPPNLRHLVIECWQFWQGATLTHQCAGNLCIGQTARWRNDEWARLKRHINRYPGIHLITFVCCGNCYEDWGLLRRQRDAFGPRQFNTQMGQI